VKKVKALTSKEKNSLLLDIYLLLYEEEIFGAEGHVTEWSPDTLESLSLLLEERMVKLDDIKKHGA